MTDATEYSTTGEPGIELPRGLALLLLRHAFVFFPDAAGEAALEAALVRAQAKRLEPSELVMRWQQAATRRRTFEPRNYPSGPLRDLIHKAMGHLDDGNELEAAQLLDLFDVLTEQLAKRGHDGAGAGPEKRTGGHPSAGAADSPSAERLKDRLKKAQVAARRQAQTRLMALLQRHRSGDAVDLGDIINAYQDDTQDLRAENLALRNQVSTLTFGMLAQVAFAFHAAPAYPPPEAP